MARPKLQLNAKEIENYAKLGATNREIARMLGCDEGTIRGRFSANLNKARADRKITLREAQWKAALAGNPALLIFLGKNELKQTDKKAVEHSGKVDHDTRNDLAALLKDEAGIEAALLLSRRLSATARENGTNGHDLSDRASTN